MHLVSLNLFSFLGQGFVVFILSFTFVLFLQIVTGFQFSLVAQLCLTLCDPMDCSMPGLPVHHQLMSLPELMSIESVMTSNHLILCHPLSSCLQSFPTSGSFQMSQLFTLGGQIIGVSASTSVLPKIIQDCSPLGWTD